MKLFISETIPDSIRSMLAGMGFSVVLLPPDPMLPVPTASHADMLIFSDKVFLTTKCYYDKNKEVFEDTKILITDEIFGNKYPMDVIFNAFVFSDTLFGKIDVLSNKVKELYKKKISITQGYSKCSTLIFGNNAITADKPIETALITAGCNVLRISPGNIYLPGYNYGFIGGASFVYEKNVVFFGDITAHPDYNRIKSFIEENGYNIIYDKSIPLTDFGGAILDKHSAL